LKSLGTALTAWMLFFSLEKPNSPYTLLFRVVKLNRWYILACKLVRQHQLPSRAMPSARLRTYKRPTCLNH